MYIYKITNKVNGKVRIGQTTRSVEDRWWEYQKYGCNQPFDEDVQTYGWNNFEFHVLATAQSVDELNDKEIYYINKYNSMHPNGYNLLQGGTNRLPCESTRQKLSEAAKRRWSDPDFRKQMSEKHKGDKNGFYGKRHSQEVKDAISASNSGKIPLTEEQLLDHSKRMTGSGNPMYGRKHSEESKEKNRQSYYKRMGKTCSQ